MYLYPLSKVESYINKYIINDFQFFFKCLLYLGVKFEKEPVLFNVAVAELGGHVPCYCKYRYQKYLVCQDFIS